MVAGVLQTLDSTDRTLVIEGFPSGNSVLDANRHLCVAQSIQPGNAGEVVSRQLGEAFYAIDLHLSTA